MALIRWVCDRCGRDEGKCIHAYDTDYRLQPIEKYVKARLICDLILSILWGMVIALMVWAIWAW